MRRISLGSNDTLATYELEQLWRFARSGGLCLIPSDTSYSVAALPFPRGIDDDSVTLDIDRALGRNGEKISLAFGRMDLVGEYVDVGPGLRALIDLVTPDALTTVLPARPQHQSAVKEHLFAPKGDIGVRLSKSQIETQLSNHFGSPITTIALYDGGEPIKECGDALRVLEEGLAAAGSSRPVWPIEQGKLPAGPVSTVVALPNVPHPVSNMALLREGAIPFDTLRRRWGELRYRRTDWGPAT